MNQDFKGNHFKIRKNKPITYIGTERTTDKERSYRRKVIGRERSIFMIKFS